MATHADPSDHTTAESTITATTSPQVIACAAVGPQFDVIVTGGTVSAIAWSRGAGSYVDTGMTAGWFRLSPGDNLKVTYSSNPTMTKIPR